MVVKFQLNIHWFICSVSQQLGYVAPVLLLRFVQLGVEELVGVVAGRVWAPEWGLEEMGRPAPGAADSGRGARHSRRRRRARVLRTLILRRVVIEEKRGKCQFRHWEICTSNRHVGRLEKRTKRWEVELVGPVVGLWEMREDHWDSRAGR